MSISLIKCFEQISKYIVIVMNKVFQNIERELLQIPYWDFIQSRCYGRSKGKTSHTQPHNKILAQKNLPVKGSRVQQKRAVQWQWRGSGTNTVATCNLSKHILWNTRACTDHRGRSVMIQDLGPWRVVTHRVCHDQGMNSHITGSYSVDIHVQATPELRRIGQ